MDYMLESCRDHHLFDFSRHWLSLSTQTYRATSEEVVKMSVGGSILRSMSVSHWKLINQLKEYVSKSSSNEKGFLFVLNKEWASVLQKLTMTYDSVESHTRRNVDTDTAIVDKKIKSEKEPPKTDSKEPAAKEDEGYSLPQVLTGLKLKKNSSQNVEMPEESIPKWKSSIEAVSKVMKKVGNCASILMSSWLLFNARIIYIFRSASIPEQGM